MTQKEKDKAEILAMRQELAEVIRQIAVYTCSDCKEEFIKPKFRFDYDYDMTRAACPCCNEFL